METPLYNILKGFCPTICELIGVKNKFWNRISNNYQNRIKFLKDEVEKKGHKTFSKIFLDNWLLNKLGNNESIEFLKYIDNLVFQIKQQIPNELYGKLRRIVEQIIENFDNNDGKRSYNSIGEIFVIDFYLKKNYSLGGIEVNLPKMKPIDFLFKNNFTNEYILIEVLNFHPKDNKIESRDGLITYFKKHYLDKYKDKSKGNVKSGLGYDMKLFPIIWIDLDIIKKYSDFFCNTGTDISEEIHIVQGLIIDEKNYQYILTPLSKLV